MLSSSAVSSNKHTPTRQLRSLSITICVVVICLGCSVMVGWLGQITWLKSIIAGRVTMKVATALGLMVTAIALLLWHQRQRARSWWITCGLYLLPSVAIAFSGVTLIEYGFNLDLGTSWLSLPDTADAVDAVVQGRMSPNTALSFLLLNTATLLLVSKYYLTSQLFTVGVMAIAAASLIGHLYNVTLFYSVGSATGMAIHTATGFVLLSVACLATQGERGWMRVLTSQQAGGLMARWLLPLVVLIPPTVGGLIWFSLQRNSQASELAIALRITLEMLILATLVWWTAQKLNQIDRQKQQLFGNLLQAEQKFRAIFNQTFQFIGLLTPEGILLEVNQTALDFGGISQIDVVGKPFWETYWWRISPKTQEQLRQAIARASQGEFVRYRVKVQGANQRIITIDFSLRPIKNQAGEVILLIPEGRDISQQIVTEQALEQSEARYRGIVEDQTELICRYLPNGTVLYVNDAYCRFFGIERGQILSQGYTPVIYEADRPRVEQRINLMNQDNPTVTIVNRVWAREQVRWTQWNNRIIVDGVGEIKEYQSVGRDITQLKDIEAKLRESEAKFRRAFEDAATGEALVSLEGKFIQVNRSFCEFVDYSKAELLQKTFQDITYGEDLDLDLIYMRQMLAGEIRTYQLEKRYINSAGDLIWGLLSVSLIRDLENKPLYFISQIQNINQVKQAEAQLNDLLQELQRSNEDLEEFASVVAHDLTSPLRKQNLLLELLQEDYGAVLEEEGNDYLARIGDLNSRMRNLVLNLLAYARVTTQTQPFAAVDLNQVVNSVVEDFALEITSLQAKIEIGELPTITGDRLQLRQLWQNLLQNALKFHSQERIPEINIYQTPTSTKFYQINLIDNGIGFEPAQQKKIFTPFHRLHTYSQYQGTGLGLAICYKIIQRHGGKIVARSQPQQGATFIIYLPKAN